MKEKKETLTRLDILELGATPKRLFSDRQMNLFIRIAYVEMLFFSIITYFNNSINELLIICSIFATICEYTIYRGKKIPEKARKEVDEWLAIKQAEIKEKISKMTPEQRYARMKELGMLDY